MPNTLNSVRPATVAHRLDSLADGVNLASSESMTTLSTVLGAAQTTLRIADGGNLASSESMTRLSAVLGAAQTTLRIALVVYAICISGIFALFANRRAEGNAPLSALFITASVFYNIFNALMFGKRVGNFLSDSYKRGWEQKDLIYLTLWFASLGLAGMTAMAGVKISEDSVSVLHHDTLIKTALGMFVFNTLSTRWAGGLDMMEKIYKEIRYNDFDRFFQDWKKYDGAALTRQFSLKADSLQNEQLQLIEYFYNQLAENKSSLSVGQELAFYGDKIVKTTLGSISLPLFAMWISLTASGLRAIDPKLEQSASFTIGCALSNLPFYFMSCFNLYPNVKLLMTLLAEKFNSENPGVRNTVLVVGSLFFLGLAIVSGGGYAMEVKNMVQNGYGHTAHDIIPDAFFTLTNLFASYFVMVIAGLVNFSNTAKFFADVLSVQKDNPPISFTGAIGAYMNFTKIPPVATPDATESMQTVTTPRHDEAIALFIEDSAPLQQVQTYSDALRNQFVTEMQTALSKNQFHADDRSALSIGDRAVKITSDAIKAGRSQWCAATSWCCSLFSRPQKTAVEAGLAEPLNSLL